MKRAVVIVTLGLLMGVQAAQADIIWLKSKVSEVNSAGGYFKMFRVEPSTQKNEEIRIEVDASTRFEGAASIRDLKKNDEVSVETNYDTFNHIWTGLDVKIVQMGITNET